VPNTAVLIHPLSTHGTPLFGSLEIVGPEVQRLNDPTAILLATRGDQRGVMSDVFLSAVRCSRSGLPVYLGSRPFVPPLDRPAPSTGTSTRF
jgi:hypothetical protein